MSFRNRLLFFFVVIVIVPMISVAAVLFRLISDSHNGKVDAGVRARVQAATRIYSQDSGGPQATRAAGSVARDQAFGAALQKGDLAAARVRAKQLLNGPYGVSQIELLRDGTAVINVSTTRSIAPAVSDLVDPNGHALGRLEVSITPAKTFAKQVNAITSLDVVVWNGHSVLASTLPDVAVDSLPVLQKPTELTVDGARYRAVTLSATGSAGERLHISLLADKRTSTAGVGDSRLLAIALLAVFLLIAVSFAILVSRSLQLQIAGLLDAARRLGAGNFATQVPIVGHDEFAELGEEFNKMARQLEERLKELREQQERLEEALRRIGEASASNLDRDALLEIMLRTAVDGVGAVVGRAFVIGAGGLEERVRIGVLAGHDEALNGVESAVLKAHEPRSTDLDGVSALCYPLTASQQTGHVLGLISVARDGRPFSAADRELFYYLAAQAAVSIENVDLHEQLHRQAVTDELTGLFNHRRFHEAIASEVERARRFHHDIGLVMIDIDDFKQVNDTFGHQQGDLVLREVGRVLRECSREIDSPARYGGEELALVLPGTNLSGAYQVAERVRAGIEGLDVPLLDGGGSVHVTASLGVASLVPGADLEASELIAAADGALYDAKHAGKNQTVRAQ